MQRNKNESLWGEFPDFYEAKHEKDDVFEILPPQKRFKIEMLRPPIQIEEKLVIPIEGELVTKTVELMKQTNRVKAMTELSRQEMIYMAHSRQVFPSITLSAETSACAEYTNPLIISPFDKIQSTTDFMEGKLRPVPEINKQIAMTVLRKALCGLLRIKGYEFCKGGAMLMFLDAMEEFYRNFLEQINHMLTIDGNDVTKSIDIFTMDKVYTAMTGTSIIKLRNYYKNDIILRNQEEIIEFKDIHSEYEQLVEESEKRQKLNLKEEYMRMMILARNQQEIMSQNYMSSSSSNPNDSDASSFSYKSSNYSYEPIKQEPIKKQTIKQEPMEMQPMKHELIKQEFIKMQPIKQEPIKKRAIKQEPDISYSYPNYY